MGPRGPIRLIAEVYLSHELDRSRRFRYYDALLPFIFVPTFRWAVFVIWAQCRTMHDGWMSTPSLELRRAVSCVIYNMCMFYWCIYIFFPPTVRVFAIFFFSFSLSFSLPKCIYIKKWIKAPNFLAYGRKWYAAYRIGVGRRAISTEPRNAYFVKSYEKLREKWRNVVISVWIGRDHNYRTLFLKFYLTFFFSAEAYHVSFFSLYISFSLSRFFIRFFSLYSIQHIRTLPFLPRMFALFISFLSYMLSFAHSLSLSLSLPLSLYTLHISIFRGTGGPAG